MSPVQQGVSRAQASYQGFLGGYKEPEIDKKQGQGSELLWPQMPL